MGKIEETCKFMRVGTQFYFTILLNKYCILFKCQLDVGIDIQLNFWRTVRRSQSH